MNRKPLLLRCGALLFALLLPLLVAGCGSGTPGGEPVPQDYPLEVQGVKILERPQSVVTLAPSLTQTLVELGLGNWMVGISDYCTLPTSPRGEEFHHQRCGAPQAPDIAAIRRAGPSVVLTTAPMTGEQLTRLQQENIDVVVLPTANTLEELRQNYRDIFRLLWGDVEGSLRAEEFLTRFDRRLGDIESRAAASPESGKLGVYVTADLLTVATGDTLEGELMELLGLENAARDYTGYLYPQEEALELNPEVILSAGMLQNEAIAAAPVYKTTPAIEDGALYRVDGRKLELRAPASLLSELWKLGEALYPGEFQLEERPDRGY